MRHHSETHHAHAAPSIDSGLLWQHSFASLGSAFAVPTQPTALPDPYWVARSQQVSRLIGLPLDGPQASTLLHALSGNCAIAGSQPIASVYSGHQFGMWAGQLGDGRAILLGETSGQEIQIKGAGRTPFSRRGDGRAVLRSSIREFLCSEAMHALGIPSTRALCVTGSDAPVYRETQESAAVVTRVAPSFIRFGHFEHFCHTHQTTALKTLADYVIERFYPQCRTDQRFGGNPYASLLEAVSTRTAHTLALWQCVGFCHGVMNTDNMSILGLTLDYGPFQFLDAYDSTHICNHSDTQGRYAFAEQAPIAHWNLFCLGQALLPLIGEPSQALATLESYQHTYREALAAGMAAKLGFSHSSAPVEQLWHDLLPLLQAQRVDYTIFWRRLSHWAEHHKAHDTSVQELFVQPASIQQWLARYAQVLAPLPPGQAAALMRKTNPKFVLRQYALQMAIAAAQNKDFSLVEQLLAIVERPYDEHPHAQSWADFPPDWASQIVLTCSS